MKVTTIYEENKILSAHLTEPIDEGYVNRISRTCLSQNLQMKLIANPINIRQSQHLPASVPASYIDIISRMSL